MSEKMEVSIPCRANGILTLHIFLQVVDSILNPKLSDEFYGKFPEDRWKAFSQFYTNSEKWLKSKHIRVWHIIEVEIVNITFEYITDMLLCSFNGRIQERAKWFLDEED